MESIGSYLKRERDLRQISLEELAQTTRIPLKMLRSLEDDRLDLLPGEVFTRGFLKSYAQALGMDVDHVLAIYGQGRRAEAIAPAPVTSITPPERGRRFGMAIALAILLIIVTLALSVAFRPRQRDNPTDLSWQLAPTSQTPSFFA